MPIIQKYKLMYVKEMDTAIDRDQRKITKRTDVMEACRKYMSDVPYEMLCVYALDNGNRIIGFMSVDGDVNQCAAYPKNIMRFLLSCGASGCILAHNHPGGTKEPSHSDWEMTKKIQKACEILDLPLLDHVIVADGETISMKDLPRWRN